MFILPRTLTLENAKVVLEQGLRAVAEGQDEFEFSQVQKIDSAAVAIMLLWQSVALKQGRTLSFLRCPAKLVTLIDTYGVANSLSCAA